ncbi:MAG: hypothetical protein J07HN4v3_02207 [Halonotius sp. J07HN4]|nr:MAG: hypothetical protein J07HN4v3_02207 [Halonotius sp. J07HN4]
MQLSQLVQIVNVRWVGVFGGVAGATAAIVVQWQLSTLSTGRETILVGLLAAVVFLLLVIVTNLVGVLPMNSSGDDAVGNE